MKTFSRNYLWTSSTHNVLTKISWKIYNMKKKSMGLNVMDPYLFWCFVKQVDKFRVIVKWRILTYKFCLGTTYPNSNHIKVVGDPWTRNGVLCTTIGKDVGLRFGTKLARHMLTLSRLPTLCKKDRIDNYKPLLVIMLGTLPTWITMLLITCWSFINIFGKNFCENITKHLIYVTIFKFDFKACNILIQVFIFDVNMYNVTMVLKCIAITMHEGGVVKGALRGVWSTNDWSCQVVYSKKLIMATPCDLGFNV
jgi:hypothetical protein